jgi:putative copper resistance protein D
MLTAAMAGTGLAEVDPSLVTTLLQESAVGRALLVRVGALLLAAGAGAAVARGLRGGFAAAAVAGGVALATVAWGGHAAATEGSAGNLHLVADVVHLLAAGAWLSALFALLFMVVRVAAEEDLRSAHRALDGFSAVGIAAVAALLLSGSISAALLLGLPDPRALVGDPYGRLLVAKLGLFLLMLMLAGLNRTWLTPRLGRQLATGDARGATTALRVSLAVETAAALAILALVARLGMLAPTGSEI